MRAAIRKVIEAEFSSRLATEDPRFEPWREQSNANNRVYRLCRVQEKTRLVSIHFWDLGDRFTLCIGLAPPNAVAYSRLPALKWETVERRKEGGLLRIGELMKPPRDYWWDALTGNEADPDQDWRRAVSEIRQPDIDEYKWIEATESATGALVALGFPLLFGGLASPVRKRAKPDKE